MNINYKLLRRPAAALSALALVVGAAAPAILGSTASAYTQMQQRSIRMDDATPSATGVTYTVSFDVKTAGTIRGVIVDFCAGTDTPLIGESCSAPAGMSLASLAFSDISGLDTVNGSWAVQTLNTGRTAELYNGSAVTSNSVDDTISFDLDAIVNPSGTGIFFARILTFSTTADADAYVAGTALGSFSNLLDYGGIALSTSTAIDITAKVAESLVFCVSGSVPGAACAGADDPDLNLGVDNGGGTFILQSPDTEYYGTVHTQLTTNALNGAVVRMKVTNNTTCAGLSTNNGTDTCSALPALGGTPTTFTAFADAGFGMCVDATAATDTTPVGAYAGNNCDALDGTTQFGLTDTAATAAPNYGDTIYTISGPVADEANDVNYGVMSVATTPAGIYTTTQSMIATSTF